MTFNLKVFPSDNVQVCSIPLWLKTCLASEPS